jgi:hypothetical protein
MPAARLEGNEEHIAAALVRVRDDIQRTLNGDAPRPSQHGRDS